MQLDEVKTLIREIQRLISGQLSDDDEPDIIDLAAQHDDVVIAVNERADEVAALLDRGLNDEAIQLAERAPSLSDLGMLLDFPELSEWTCVLADFEVAAVPELPHETIAQLEDAYSTTADSKKLLQRFRSLSLARAPLADRIDVLRRLSVKDPGNDQWTQGIHTYETHRLKSIGQDLKTAREQRDLVAVARIDREVNEAAWVVKVPSNLRKDAQSAHRMLQQADAQKRIQPVAEQLSIAYSEFSIPKATQLLDRFHALADIANLPPDHEIMDVAGPAVEWIEGKLNQQRIANERQQAIVNLQQGLDRDAPLAELETHYYKAIENGEPVPQVLETRLANKISANAVAEKRKRIAVVTSSVVGVGLLIAVVAGLVIRVNFNSRVHKNTQQMTQLLEDAAISGNTAPLESRFEELKTSDPAILESPEVAALEKKLQALIGEEDGRVRGFNTLLATVAQVAESPEWSTLSSAEQALDQANSITKNENERAAVLKARQQFATAKADLRKRTDKQFTSELDAVQTLMETIDRSNSETYKIPIDRLTAALKLENISVESLSQGKGLLSKLTTDRDLAEKNRLVALDLAGIGRNSTSIDSFTTAAATYIQNHSGTQRANELEDIQRDESGIWKAVSKWNEFRSTIPTDSKQMQPAAAKAWLQSYKEFEKAAYPGTTRIANRAKAIEAIARRTTGPTGSEPAITNLFSGRFMRDCYVVKTGGKWHYTDTKPTFRSNTLVKYVYFENGFSSAADRSASTPINEITNSGLDPKTNPDKTWLSAQSVMAVKVDQITADPKLDFEQKILTVMGLVLNEKEMDPLLHLLLVENILGIGSSGSTFIEQETSVVRAAMAKIQVPRTADWVNPESAIKAERNEAGRQVKLHATLIRSALSKAIESRDAEFNKPIGPSMTLVGWFHRDMNDRWAITLNPTAQSKSQSDLLMFHLLNGKRTISVVGRTTKDKPVVATSIADSHLREGRPIFIGTE